MQNRNLRKCPDNRKKKSQTTFFNELRRIQNSQEIAFDISTVIEGDYKFYRGHEQTWWISGDEWYRIFRCDTNQGEYTEEYVQTDGKQYVYRDADNIPKLGDLDWTQLPDGQVEMPPLLTRDWTQCKILLIQKEESSDGGVVTVWVQGDMEQTSECTYYEHTHTFHLDENGRLVGVVEYSFADKYINYLGTEGRFDMNSWSHVTFPATKVLDIETTVQNAVDDVQEALSVE